MHAILNFASRRKVVVPFISLALAAGGAFVGASLRSVEIRAAVTENKELPCVQTGCPTPCVDSGIHSIQDVAINNPVCGLALLPPGSGCSRGPMVGCATVYTYLFGGCLPAFGTPGQVITEPRAGFGSTPC